MNYTRKVVKDLYYVGASNHTLEKFENMFPLNEGVSFNSFLLLDDKTVLFDTVDRSCEDEFISNVKSLLKDRTLDYLVIHHMEPDHAANIENILKIYPNVKIIGTSKTFNFFEQFFNENYKENYKVITDGEELNVGKNTLKFLTAPLVHWPEVFITYLKEQKALLSADAFGSFGSIKGHLFSNKTDIKMSEVRRYYAGILSKYKRNVENLLEKIKPLEIKYLLPLHGLLHKSKKEITTLFEKYSLWTQSEPEEKGVIITYVSMYGNTERAASILANMLSDNGVKYLRLYDLNNVDHSYILGDLYRFSNLVIMGPNYNTNIHPTIKCFIESIKYQDYTKRNYSIVANRTWGGRALNVMQDEMTNLKECNLIGEPLTIISKPNEDIIVKLEELAKTIKESL